MMLIALAAYGAPRDDDYGRRGRDRGSYEPGYGPSYGSGVVDRTLLDLRRAASNARLDGHERSHFNSAVKELQKFQDRWRDGRFDTGRLDKAIDSLRHLANADRIHPRDRGVLARDMEALRDFRSRGNYGGGGYGGPNTRGGRGWPY